MSLLPYLLVVSLVALSSEQDQPKQDQSKSAQIPWCCNYNEALTLARESQKPVLVCFNMDNEVANDHASKEIYHDSEFAKLCESFVPVICSVFKHEEKEADVGGAPKSVCTRFGWVTCDEHLKCEVKARTALIQKSENIAPQHIVVAPDGTILERRAYHMSRDELMGLMKRALLRFKGADALSPDQVKEEKARIDALFEKAEKGDQFMGKHEPIAEILKIDTPQSWNALVDYLKRGKDDFVRVEILMLLGQSGNFLALEPLSAATKDSSSFVALAAVDSLGKLALPTALKDLKSLLARYKEGHGHGRVLRAYAACGANDPDVMEFVVRKAKGGDPMTRAHALIALKAFDATPQISDTLSKALHDQNNLLCAAAAYTIGTAQFEDCRKDLKWFVENTNVAELRDLAQGALTHLDHRGLGAELDSCFLDGKLMMCVPWNEFGRL